MPKPLGYVRLSIAELGLFIIENGTTDADLAAAVRKWHKALATQNAALEPFAAGQIAEAQGFAEEQRRKALAGHEARKERERHPAPEPKNDDQANVAGPLPNPAEPLPKQANKQTSIQTGGKEETRARSAPPTPSDVEREEGKDPLRVVVVEVFGARGIGAALRDLRALGATPETLRKVIALADKQWEGRAFGPDAIVKHWRRLVEKIPKDPRVCVHGLTVNCFECAMEESGARESFGTAPEGFFEEVSKAIGRVKK